MLQRAIMFTALLVLVGTAMFTGATSAGASATTETIHFSDTFPFSFFNECTGEDVAGIVDVKSTIHITEDSAGGFHAHFHDTFLGTALGLTSGIRYVGPQTDHDSFSDNGPSGQLEETFTLNFRFNSQGSSDNILTHLLFHITVNSNGQVTALVDNVRAECRG